jgi:transposase-like protein
MPRAARAPHSAKVPDICPHCGGRALTRRGTRTKKFEIVQLWRCASCKRVFTPAPQALRNKTYPLRIILEALTTYSLGYSIEQTLAHMKSKRGRSIAPSTLANWIAEH